LHWPQRWPLDWVIPLGRRAPAAEVVVPEVAVLAAAVPEAVHPVALRALGHLLLVELPALQELPQAQVEHVAPAQREPLGPRAQLAVQRLLGRRVLQIEPVRPERPA